MAKEIKSISIIGSGNIAHHFAIALSQKVKINGVFGRNEVETHKLAEKVKANGTTDLSRLKPADLILICVNDDEINGVINQLDSEQVVAYTAGAVELKSIDRKNNVGIFYPLQTFSKEREIDLWEVPFLIEATDNFLAHDLFDLAWKLSRKVEFANSTQRKHLHLAAVFVNNFSNHLASLAQNHLDKNELSFDLLKPLILETAKKLQSQKPQDAQTGPAIRNDKKTIASHLSLLDEETKMFYQILTDSIQKQANKDGKL
ncbi:MAG: putative short-subunit dehydrogenase-like oxidoreductase (DUF2520 family) [Lentimonas sp.]|jgi:predicted short-subunit dehydrogenase-like oxidoreductase (DUF2520 family)